MIKNKPLIGVLLLAVIFLSASFQLSLLIEIYVGGKKNIIDKNDNTKIENQFETGIISKAPYNNKDNERSKNIKGWISDSEDKFKSFSGQPSFKLQSNGGNSFWYSKDWRYRKNITISASNVDEDLINFPLLIDIYDSDLKKALNNGFDILFTDKDNNKLAHEFEVYNKSYSISEVHLTAWIKTNLSSTVDTIIMMYFGYPFADNQENPAGVWSNGYEAVWHMNEDPSGPILDSSGNLHNGQSQGQITSDQSQQSIVSNGLTFDGTDDRIVTNNINSNSWNELTLEAWIKRTSVTNEQSRILTKENPGGGGYAWGLGTNFKKLRIQLATDGPGATNFSTDILGIDQADTWYHIAFSWSEVLNSTSIILNGEIISIPFISGTSIFDSSNDAVIGSVATGVSGASFHGLIDEVRVSKLSRTFGWINTTRINQLSPQTFSTLNSLEILQLDGNWAFNSLSYRKNITILASEINEDLNNFSLLLNITDSDLKEKTQSNGQDILFTDSSGIYLEHEIEKFTKNYNSTHSELVTWIKIPFLSSIFDNNITMYYGNSTVTMFDKPVNVWDDYMGVWHLSEIVLNGSSSIDTHFDSTFNGNNGDQEGNGYQSGQIAQSQDFDGLDDFINVTNPKNLDIFESDNYFISAWIFRDTGSTNDTILAKKVGTQNTDPGYILYINNSDGLLYFEITSDLANQNKTWVYSNTNFNSLTNGWHQIVVQFSLTDGSKWKIYIDGIDDNTDNNTSGDNPKDVINGINDLSLVFGSESDNENNFNGKLDEIRIGRGLRSPNWILLEYNNQLNPQSFYRVDQEQFGDFESPIVNKYGVEDSGMGQAIYWANITDLKGIVSSAKVKINSSIYDMVYNGSLWTYSDNPIFNNTYFYSIVNTTDSQGNFLLQETPKYNYTFDKDIVDPEIINWDYDANLGYLGTFKANVSDSWGSISNVTLVVTSCNGCGASPNISANMVKVGVEYINDSIFMIKGQITFRVIAVDSAGNSITSNEKTRNVANKAPQVYNIQFSPQISTTNQSLNITRIYFDPDGDSESDSQIRWYKNGELQVQLNDLLSIDRGNLTRNDDWYVTYRPRDGFDYGIINSTIINATISNSAPIITNLEPSTNIRSNVDLQATWSFFDYDSDELQGYTIRWYRNSVYQSIYFNNTVIPNSATTKSDTWYYTLQIYDGIDYSSKITSNSISILNTAPIAQDVKIRDGSVEVNDDLNLIANYSFFDHDGDAEKGYVIYWFSNGIYNSSVYNQTIVSKDDTAQGDIWKFVISVFDGTDWSSNKTSLAVSIGTVLNNPPTASNLGILNDNSLSCLTVDCFTNQSLHAEYIFIDINGNNESDLTEIRWYLNGTLQPQLNDSLIVPSSLTKKNDEWYFTVTPYDELGLNGSTYTSSTVTIKNAKPKIELIQLSPTTAYTTSTLQTYFTYSDIDNDEISNISIRWYINGILAPQHNNFTQIDSDKLFKHDLWKFNVSVYDGTTWSNWKYSGEIEILNSRPILGNISLIGGTNTLENISLQYDFFDSDNDTDSSTFTWWIFRFPTLNSLTTGKELDNSEFIAGDFIYVYITPNDGEGPYVSDVVNSLDYTYGFRVVVNEKPQLDGSPKIVDINGTTNFFATNNLYVIYNASDLDGILDGNDDFDIDYNSQEKIVNNAEYRWYKLIGGNWYVQSGLITNILPNERLIKGDSWKVGVKILDRAGAESIWYNSSVIVIRNTAPVIQDLTWSSLSPTSFEDLTVIYTFSDIDNDIEDQSSIRWFVNGIEVNEIEVINQSTLSQIFFNKGDTIFALIIPYDGSQFGLEYNTSSFTGLLFIKNSLPEVETVDINNNKQQTFTDDSLLISWSYFDADGDEEIISNVNITWYRFNRLTLIFDLQSHLNNQTIVGFGNTSKNEQWYVIIQVFDGQNYSISKASKFLYIQNSVIEINSVRINSNESETFSNDTLKANFEYSDLDGDSYINYSIFWYRNGTLFSTNLLELDSFYLEKGYEWFFIISLTDDDITWTNNVTSQPIFVKNSIPLIIDIQIIIPDNREFYVDDEDVSISYNFSDTDNDADQSLILWYRKAEGSEVFELQDHLTNLTVINYSFTSYGDTWKFIIIPSDGDESSLQIPSRLIEIFSAPKIQENGTGPPDPSEAEGIYQIWVVAIDEFEQINYVSADINQAGQDNLIIDLIQRFTGEYTLPLIQGPDNNWTVNIDIFRNNDRQNFADYVGKVFWIDIKVNTTINFNGQDYFIQRTKRISLLIQDLSPPRVKNVHLTFDNEDDPSSVTFTVGIEEFGSNIDNISLYYYFQTQTDQGAQLSRNDIIRYSFNIPLEYKLLVLEYENRTGDIHYYSGTVDFNPNSTTTILFYIQTFDFSGNFNLDAFPDGHNEQTAPTWELFIPGLPTDIVAGIILLIIFFAIIFTYIGIRRFRKTEIVGLDIDKVVREISHILQSDVQQNINAHTMGVMVSTFHQTQGPIPLFVHPNLLMDNLELLIDLSDRSFGAVRFVDDFDREIQTNVEYTISTNVTITSMTYGFSLDRPEYRGGQENITFNILVHKPHDVILTQFLEVINPYIKDIHTIMNKNPEKREEIEVRIINLRDYLTRILLSYQKIYGDEIFEDD